MTQQNETDPASKNGKKSRGRPFEPGHPGGPGRPAGSRNRATLILDAIADEEAAEILRTTLEKAKGGDLRAAEIILSRVWPQRKGRTVTFDLPSVNNVEGVLTALNSVLDATAKGELTPDEAHMIGSLLEIQRKSIETVEIEQRLSKLEAQNK